jgi:hypothetical protein
MDIRKFYRRTRSALSLPGVISLAAVASVYADNSPAVVGQSGMSAAHSARAAAYDRCLERSPAADCLNTLSKSIGSGFPAVSDFSAPGPYQIVSSNEGPDCTIIRPEILGERGLRHPVILWGNGTGAVPETYAGLLANWASHGFVVAAARTTNAGTGVNMLACLDYLEVENGNPHSDYARKLNTFQVGAAGHSQGGGGTLMAGRDSRIRATVPFQPYVLGLGYQAGTASIQHAPMLLLSGSADTLAGPTFNQRPVFLAANVPVFWANLNGASHFVPVGSAGAYRGPSTAWFRLHLMQDENARDVFYGADCRLCTNAQWIINKKDIP